jgi:pimeloyl-ACP methyl ester carboxylesterase
MGAAGRRGERGSRRADRGPVTVTRQVDLFEAALPHGITLACRAAGGGDGARVLLLHGFPEAAFVWDDVMQRLAPQARCVAPNLRGYDGSSAPADVESYRAKHLVADVAALIDHLGGHVDVLVAHDWGGAVAWNLAVAHPNRIGRLLIVNAPHPALFLRDLQTNPRQQAASAYMNFLCRPDAEALLAADDFARLWPFFTSMGAADATHPGGGWLTEAPRDRYRAVWRRGLTGPLNYYRASPLRPPTEPGSPVLGLGFAPEQVTVRVPTTVLWADADTALPPSLLDGLDAYVPELRVIRVPGATHWIVHERPALVAETIAGLLP